MKFILLLFLSSLLTFADDRESHGCTCSLPRAYPTSAVCFAYEDGTNGVRFLTGRDLERLNALAKKFVAAPPEPYWLNTSPNRRMLFIGGGVTNAYATYVVEGSPVWTRGYVSQDPKALRAEADRIEAEEKAAAEAEARRKAKVEADWKEWLEYQSLTSAWEKCVAAMLKPR